MKKYSYMPIDKNKSIVETYVTGDYFIDTDEKRLQFRNQYGNIYFLAARSQIIAFASITFLIGLTIGKLL